jgi:hypothetical protein
LVVQIDYHKEIRHERQKGFVQFGENLTLGQYLDKETKALDFNIPFKFSLKSVIVHMGFYNPSQEGIYVSYVKKEDY